MAMYNETYTENFLHEYLDAYIKNNVQEIDKRVSELKDMGLKEVYNKINAVHFYALVYQGDKDSAPTSRYDGSALMEGDMYFDTTKDKMMIYKNGSWTVLKSLIDQLDFIECNEDETLTYNLPKSPKDKDVLFITDKNHKGHYRAIKVTSDSKINNSDNDYYIDYRDFFIGFSYDAVNNNWIVINDTKRQVLLENLGNFDVNQKYIANSSANYISSATSLTDADNRLDTAIKNNENNLNQEIQDRKDADNDLDVKKLDKSDNSLATKDESSNDGDLAPNSDHFKNQRINSYIIDEVDGTEGKLLSTIIHKSKPDTDNDKYMAWEILGPADTDNDKELFYIRSGIDNQWNSIRKIYHTGYTDNLVLIDANQKITGSKEWSNSTLLFSNLSVDEPSDAYVLWNNGGNVGVGKQKAIDKKTDNYSMDHSDTVILGDASNGDITITLPTPETNKRYIIKKVDSSSNKVTVSQNDTDTIDGENSIDLAKQWQYIHIVSDGTDWYVI